MKKTIYILFLALTFTSCEQISKKLDEISATELSTNLTEMEFPILGTWYVEDPEKEVENTAFNFIEYNFETPTNVDGKLTGVVHTISNDAANPSRTGSYEVLSENKLILSFPNESPQDFIYSYNPEYQKVDISFAEQNRILTNAKPIVQERCPEGDVHFKSQAEVDKFVIDYPNCSKISGKLFIGAKYPQVSDITNLSGLNRLKTVEGKMEIKYNSALTNLNGLNNLTSIGGNMDFSQNATITNLDGLSSLKSIGGKLEIIHNPLLTNLDGLSSLTSIGASLWINQNPELVDISGLRNIDLTTKIDFRLDIYFNRKLAVCNLPNFCTYLLNDHYVIFIKHNSTNCIDKQALQNACENNL